MLCLQGVSLARAQALNAIARADDWYYAPADAAWWTRVGGWLARYDRIRWAFSATEAVDFFPLTEHSVDDRSWIAWQWRQVHDGKERGVVQVFRQFACPVSHATLPIYALDPAKNYCTQPANLDSCALPDNAVARLVRRKPVCLQV